MCYFGAQNIKWIKDNRMFLLTVARLRKSFSSYFIVCISASVKVSELIVRAGCEVGNLNSASRPSTTPNDHIYRMVKESNSNILPNQTIVSDQSELTILLCQPMIIYVGY